MIYMVIPVFNRKGLTRKCLESLAKQTNKEFQVIIVDDGSKDGTSEMIAEEFPEVIVLKGNGNLWWTGAINMGISHALSLAGPDDYIMVQNDDLVVKEDYIETFYQLGEKHPNTLIQSVEVIKNKAGQDIIQIGAYRINWFTAKLRNLNGGKDLAQFPKGHFEEASILTGRGVLIPSKAFRELGLYNNDHYMQCGDPEFPRRAAMAGYKLIVSYDAPVFSYPVEEGHFNYHNRYKLSMFKSYFFDIKSNQYLRYRFYFAYDATPNIIQGTIYFLFDLSRITFRFFRRVSFS